MVTEVMVTYVSQLNDEPCRCQINVDDCSCHYQPSGQRGTTTFKVASVDERICSGVLLSGGDYVLEAAETPHHSTLLGSLDSIEDRSAVYEVGSLQ